MAGSLGVDGLSSGLNTTQIISQLIAIERRPQQLLQTRQSTLNQRLAALRSINTKLTSMSTAAGELAKATGWDRYAATSSNSDVVTARTGSGAAGGSLTFTVDNLAAAGVSVSSGYVSATSNIVASGKIAISKGGDAYGFASFANGTGLSTGKHTVEVTQASAAATKTGSAVGVPLSITAGVNDTITVSLDGAGAQTYTIAAGTYLDADELATAVQTAMGTSDWKVSNSGGALQISTVDHGSAATMQVTGGAALAAIGLTTDGAALSGTDAVVELDGNAQTLTDVRAGATATLDDGTGKTLTATLASGGLKAGSIDNYIVDTLDGSLGSVVSQINSAGAGITATAVQVSTNQFKLQLSSTTTGAKSNVSTAASQFSGGLGTFQAATSGADAKITVGTGGGAYALSSSTNSLTGAIPGVTLTLKAKTTSAVTVDVSRDSDAIADKVQGMVDAANGVLSEIRKYASVNTTTNTGGVLTGDSTVRRLQQDVFNAVGRLVGQSSIGAPSLAGVGVNQTGTLTFDRSKFLDAYGSNPDAVRALFQRGGTASSSDFGFFSSTNKTLEGSYSVAVTQVALRGEKQGSDLSGQGNTITGAETITVRIGSTEASYAAGAGATLESIVSGLNTALADKGLRATASLESNRLVMRTADYGSQQSFEVKSSAIGAGQSGIAALADTYTTYAGQDVAGTINGVAAGGSGQILSAPADDKTLAGLALKVTATSTFSGATFAYQPGVSQRLMMLTTQATDSVNGFMTTKIAGLDKTSSDLTKQISGWDSRLAKREEALRSQFTALETNLSKLKSQGSWLTTALANLPSWS